MDLTPAQDPQRVEVRGAECRHQARQRSDDQEQQRDHDKSERVVRRDAVELRRQHARHPRRGEHAGDEARKRHGEPCRSTNRRISARRAPSAARIASSRDRCDTEYDSRPKRPTAAMISAKAAKPPSSAAYSRGRASVVEQPLLERHDHVCHQPLVGFANRQPERSRRRSRIAGRARQQA